MECFRGGEHPVLGKWNAQKGHGSLYSPLYFTFSSIWWLLRYTLWASLVAQRLKCLPAMWETWVRSLGGEDPLEKEMATHSSILAWRIPWMEKAMAPHSSTLEWKIQWMEEPGRLQSMGSLKVGHD